QQRALRGLVERCRSAGTPQVRPCRLGSRIHAADTPHSDTAPPLTISRCCWWVSTLVDTVDPRQAWMLFDGCPSTHGVDLLGWWVPTVGRHASPLEPQPHARFGEQVARIQRRVAQLVPQLADQDAQVVGVVLVGGSPDFLQDLWLGNHPPGIAAAATAMRTP